MTARTNKENELSRDVCIFVTLISQPGLIKGRGGFMGRENHPQSKSIFSSHRSTQRPGPITFLLRNVFKVGAICFFPSFHSVDLVRLDRLLLLLDTGSTTSVRTTAAKQLAQLAAKSVISDVALEDDVKAHRHHQPLGDSSGWTELMAVIARVCGHCYVIFCFGVYISFAGSPLSSF